MMREFRSNESDFSLRSIITFPINLSLAKMPSRKDCNASFASLRKNF
jgi:hypothetical protein